MQILEQNVSEEKFSSEQNFIVKILKLQFIFCNSKFLVREQNTFAVGHLALGYILGKATSKSLNVNLNIPLVLVASIIIDIDLLMRLLIPNLEHRGPIHSLIFIFLFFLPVFVFYRERVAPYFVAVVQHSVLGDYFTGGGVQLLWPLTPYWYGNGIKIISLTNVFIEWTLFLMFLTIMLKTKDVWILFQHHASNILLSIPIVTVLLPTLLSFPLSVPLELIIPHIIYLILFAFSIIIDFQYIVSKLRE